MLSRLNLPVTVATLLVASVYGTGVSHAGQAGGALCNTAPPVLRAGQTVGDVQADLVFTPPYSVDGVPGKVIIPPGQRGLQATESPSKLRFRRLKPRPRDSARPREPLGNSLRAEQSLTRTVRDQTRSNR